MTQYNLITLSDLSTTSSVHNRTLVCGSLISSGCSSFATGSNLIRYRPTRAVLEVNGLIRSGDTLTINIASMGVSCRPNRSISISGGANQYVADGRTVTINEGRRGAGVYLACTLADRCNNAANDIRELSRTLARQRTLPGNKIDIPVDRVGPAVIYVNAISCTGIAVFNVCASDLFNPKFVQSIHLVTTFRNVSLVVINICGENITLSNETIVLDCNWFREYGRPRTIWNFHQAKNIVLQNSIKGALLAPWATVTTNQPLPGTVAVNTLITTDEVQLPNINLPSCI